MCIRDSLRYRKLKLSTSWPTILAGVQIAVITQGIKTLEELLLLLTKWENVDGNVESYNAHKQINTNNTQKQNAYKSKQWKKHDREQNSSKFSNHKVASVAKDNQDNEHGQKKRIRLHGVCPCKTNKTNNM